MTFLGFNLSCRGAQGKRAQGGFKVGFDEPWNWGAISVPDELLHEVPLLLRDDPQLGELTGQRPELPAIQRHRLNTHRGS